MATADDDERGEADDKARRAACPKCAEPIVVGAKVCHFCGSKVKWVAAKPSATAGLRAVANAMLVVAIPGYFGGMYWKSDIDAKYHACQEFHTSWDSCARNTTAPVVLISASVAAGALAILTLIGVRAAERP